MGFFRFPILLLTGFLRGGCSRGGGNWGTLRIPREDWGTLGNIRETPPLGPPPLNNPIMLLLMEEIRRTSWDGAKTLSHSAVLDPENKSLNLFSLLNM